MAVYNGGGREARSEHSILVWCQRSTYDKSVSHFETEQGPSTSSRMRGTGLRRTSTSAATYLNDRWQVSHSASSSWPRGNAALAQKGHGLKRLQSKWAGALLRSGSCVYGHTPLHDAALPPILTANLRRYFADTTLEPFNIAFVCGHHLYG
jgi:hypothetical protein